MLEDLGNMTVKEFINSNFYKSISIMGFGNQYTFFSTVGAINFSFDIEGSAEIIELYEDEICADIEDMEELYDTKLTNVSFDYMEYSLILDESADDIMALKDFEEEMLYDCIVEKCCYESFS